jgi:nucleoside-diphosphate-sugar epimerase
VELAIEKQPENYRLYNCGYGKAVAIKDLVNKIVSSSGKAIKIEHDLSKPTIKTSLFLDCGLAKQELGWQPTTTLEDGIAKTISWWCANVNLKIPEKTFES